MSVVMHLVCVALVWLWAQASAGWAQSNEAVVAALAGTSDKPVDLFYAARSEPVFTTREGLTDRGTAVVAELAKAADYGLSEGAYKVPAAPSVFETPAAQAAHEATIASAVLRYVRDARGGRIPDPSRISATFDMNPTFVDPVRALDLIATAEDAAAALRNFHPAHAGFHFLQKAYVAARTANAPAETLRRIEVNLERWRWMPVDVGAFHVWNNVPEQLTRVIKDGAVIHTDRIVVGKPGHSTPVMSAPMQYVIFHPSWGVPNGIKTNEIGPMLRRASARNDSLFGFGEPAGRATAALARHQLRAFHNGREVNPDQVDWRTADVRQFTFTQPPSGRNVLGVVKFRFPNKFDVYMHDTQEKHLFVHQVRAYSHGCMRVQNPLKLAGVLLGHDKGWSQERVDAFIPGGRTADITLTTPIPVHLTYFTVSADDTGKLSQHGDIYGVDNRIASALGGQPIALAAAKPAPAAAATPRAQRTAAAATPRPAAAWNPFALSAN